MDDIIDELSTLGGMTIKKVEVVSMVHILRLHLEENCTLDFVGNWRIRKEQNVRLGALDADFYVDVDDAFLDREDARFAKKVSSLVGKEVMAVSSVNDINILVQLSGEWQVDVMLLSSEGYSIKARMT